MMNNAPQTAYEYENLHSADSTETDAADEYSDCGCDVNVSTVERVGSLMAGSIITVVGLSLAQRGRLPIVALGAGLLYRGLTGKCQLYDALGVNTARRDDLTRSQFA